MTTTILKVSRNYAGREALVRQLANAGVSVVEVDDWDEARERLTQGEAALVVCDGEALGPAAVPKDTLRQLSHDLRTPLSAMAGWLHLMESGKLDEAGMKRAIDKLRGNIDDQVRTIDRYLGTTTQQGSS
jgi:signal transduction histidine kinase